jgi:hypothetical protein
VDRVIFTQSFKPHEAFYKHLWRFPRQVSLLRHVLVDAVQVSDAVRATGSLASRFYYNPVLYFKIKQKVKMELFNR